MALPKGTGAKVYTVTFRCTTSGFDLGEKCAHVGGTLGQWLGDLVLKNWVQTWFVNAFWH